MPIFLRERSNIILKNIYAIEVFFRIFLNYYLFALLTVSMWTYLQNEFATRVACTSVVHVFLRSQDSSVTRPGDMGTSLAKVNALLGL